MQPDARRVRERELRRKEQIKGEGGGGGGRPATSVRKSSEGLFPHAVRASVGPVACEHQHTPLSITHVLFTCIHGNVAKIHTHIKLFLSCE